jgi:mitochondrial import inner membrane translocase subunit TIM54
VAAAIDYEIIGGKHHGALANKLALDIKTQRRLDAGLDPPLSGDLLLASKLQSRESRHARLLQGGSILMGRSTLKEYLAGLRRGYTDSLELINQEELLAQQLAQDNVFDEHETDYAVSGNQNLIIPTSFDLTFRPIGQVESEYPEQNNRPTPTFPSLPPLLLVPFINRIGIKQIPMMILEFFNRRQDVRIGGNTALTIIQALTRDFTKVDLDWGVETEAYYKTSLYNLPSDIESAQNAYYKELPKRLAIARALDRQEREPTRDESRNPPPTEVELRAERLSREFKWRNSLHGWDLIRPDHKIEWDERFASLKVFVDHSTD